MYVYLCLVMNYYIVKYTPKSYRYNQIKTYIIRIIDYKTV